MGSAFAGSWSVGSSPAAFPSSSVDSEVLLLRSYQINDFPPYHDHNHDSIPLPPTPRLRPIPLPAESDAETTSPQTTSTSATPHRPRKLRLHRRPCQSDPEVIEISPLPSYSQPLIALGMTPFIPDQDAMFNQNRLVRNETILAQYVYRLHQFCAQLEAKYALKSNAGGALAGVGMEELLNVDPSSAVQQSSPERKRKRRKEKDDRHQRISSTSSYEWTSF